MYVITEMSSEIFTKNSVVIGMYVYINVHESHAVDPT
jgi:hypothetical protein